MSKSKPSVWCRPLVGSQRYDVLLTDEKIGNEDDFDPINEEAATLWRITTVAIRNSLSAERKEDCFAHEVFGHALLEATGLGRSFWKYLGITEKQWDDFEEECLVRQYVPALLALLKANGWLNLPPLPESTAQASAASAKAAKAAKRRQRKRPKR